MERTGYVIRIFEDALDVVHNSQVETVEKNRSFEIKDL
jgi:hypothetical protein